VQELLNSESLANKTLTVDSYTIRSSIIGEIVYSLLCQRLLTQISRL